MVDSSRRQSNRARLAIVHDALVNTGGAERVLTYMHETFPDAPIFTSVYLPDQTYAEFRSARVFTLPGSGLARTERRCKQLFPLWMLGFRRLSLKVFDTILISTSWGAKFIDPCGSARYACYCYVPFRLLWNPQSYTASSTPVNRLGQRLVEQARAPLRKLDYRATHAFPYLATTCANMARQIARCYDRQPQIIYAPIRLSDYRVNETSGDYYLAVSRLMSHKRLDLAVQACTALRRKLIVVGDGPERPLLERLAGDTIRFVGRISDAELKDLYAGCRAVIFPSDEDYGLVPLEAQASGRPVIAYGAGGALETVVEGQTGLFFVQQTLEAVIDAIRMFETMRFDVQAIRQAVQRFDVEHFKHELHAFVFGR